MKQNVLEIIKAVDELYENPKCELMFSSNYELLVAVILSAQCTDKRVNHVTRELFKEYNCATCHVGENLGGHTYELMGLRKHYFADRNMEMTNETCCKTCFCMLISKEIVLLLHSQ